MECLCQLWVGLAYLVEEPGVGGAPQESWHSGGGSQLEGQDECYEHIDCLFVAPYVLVRSTADSAFTGFGLSSTAEPIAVNAGESN